MVKRLTTKDKKAVLTQEEQLRWIADFTKSGGDNTPEARDARIERAKKGIKFCVEYYFPHYATCECADFQIEMAEAVKRCKTIKAFIEWARAHAKSVWVNVFIPFWLKINNQMHYMVLIGSSFDKACELLDDIKMEFEVNDRIIRDFGEQKRMGSWENGNFTTTDGTKFKALGFGANVRGLRKGSQRPDYITGDDLETRDINRNPKRQDALAKWIERDLLPTMDGPIRRFLFANNRYAPRMIQTVLQELHPKWRVFHVKAYNESTYEPAWPAKYTPEYWQELERELGTLTCRSEYNQKAHVEGKIFKNEYFRYEDIPRLNQYDQILGYWDVAYSGEPTADTNSIKLFGRKGDYYYRIRTFCRHCTPYEAFEWMFLVQSMYKTRIPWWYESQFWNESLALIYKEVRKKFKRYPEISLIRDDRRKPNKYDRILATLLPLYQQGRIIDNIKEKSSNDHQVAQEQTKGIEPGYKCHDDSPDADEGALYILTQSTGSITNDEDCSWGNDRRNKRH